MNETIYLAAAIGVAACVTWLTRAVPFLIFRNRPLPDTAVYLGNVLPPAIMMILVVYCLRNTSFLTGTHGIPELCACLVVFILQKTRKNMYLSIVAGTVCYMVLLRVGGALV